MTKKNKITVIVVGVLAMAMLGGLIFWLFKSPDDEKNANAFDLSVPAPGIDSTSGDLQKLKGYNKEDVAAIKGLEDDGLANSGQSGPLKLDSLAEAIGLLSSRNKGHNNPYGEELFESRSGGRSSYSGRRGGSSISEDLYEDEEPNPYLTDLEKIQGRQQQLLSTIRDISTTGSHGGVVDLDSLLKVVNQGKAKVDSVPLTTSFGQKNKDYRSFYGPGWTSGEDGSVLLTPLEIIENKMLKQGETLPLRTLKELNLKGRRIPAGTVLYGKIAVADRRMNIKITGILLKNLLVPAKMTIMDYDGLPGIELKGNEWFQIPSDVSQDVYKAAMSTYQQSQVQIGGTGANRVPLEDIAAISAADKVAQEIFAKIRVFVPYKYRLWLKVDEDNDSK